jgi:hypothetical protein
VASVVNICLLHQTSQWGGRPQNPLRILFMVWFSFFLEGSFSSFSQLLMVFTFLPFVQIWNFKYRVPYYRVICKFFLGCLRL